MVTFCCFYTIIICNIERRYVKVYALKYVYTKLNENRYWYSIDHNEYNNYS